MDRQEYQQFKLIPYDSLDKGALMRLDFINNVHDPDRTIRSEEEAREYFESVVYDMLSYRFIDVAVKDLATKQTFRFEVSLKELWQLLQQKLEEKQ